MLALISKHKINKAGEIMNRHSRLYCARCLFCLCGVTMVTFLSGSLRKVASPSLMDTFMILFTPNISSNPLIFWCEESFAVEISLPQYSILNLPGCTNVFSVTVSQLQTMERVCEDELKPKLKPDSEWKQNWNSHAFFKNPIIAINISCNITACQYSIAIRTAYATFKHRLKYTKLGLFTLVLDIMSLSLLHEGYLIVSVLFKK